MRTISKLPQLLVLLGLVGAVATVGESSAFAQRYYGRGYYSQPGRYATPGSWYGVHGHDGFYLRLTAGAGYLSASETYGVVTDNYSGLGGAFTAAFGGTVAPNLIIYGELLVTEVSNAEYSVNNVSAGYSQTDLTQFGIGPGIAYYFEPVNLYLSGTLAFTKMSFSDTYSGVAQGDTNLGIGASFMLGKEWWVSPDWGIGLAGQLYLASMGDTVNGYNTRMQSSMFALLFSATFN